MILSTSGKAAVKSVIFLASRFEAGKNSTIREIAGEVGENEHTIAKILQILVKQDIIQSVKGPAGGFYLSKKQYGQSLLNVAEAIEGKNIFNRCGLGLYKCSKTHPCPIHFEYQEAREMAENIFRKKRISDLCDSLNKGLSFLSD